MSNLPVADLLAAAVIVICIIISLTRGIIAEAGAMVAWVVSFIAARTLAVPFADVVFKSVEPHSLAVAMGFTAVFFGMVVAETGTIVVKQFDVCRWFGKHQPFAWRRIRCSERCDFGDTGSDGFFTH